MGFNISNRKRREAVLRGTLFDFRDWTLTLTCAACQNRRLLPVRDFMAIYSEDTRIGVLIGRFRCSMPGCGTAPCQIVIKHRLHEIVLVGQGAYG